MQSLLKKLKYIREKKKKEKIKHKWRKCPLGFHWRSSSEVDQHKREQFSVKEYYRKGSCVENRSGKDTLYADEIFLITNSYLIKRKLTVSPNSLDYKKGNEFDYMKGLKVKKYNLLLISALLSINAYSGQEHCFNKEIKVYCEEQKKGHYSLEGEFYKGKNKFSFSSRKAFDGQWCQDSLESIQSVTVNNDFCIDFEESSGDILTINNITSTNSNWSYFE